MIKIILEYLFYAVSLTGLLVITVNFILQKIIKSIDKGILYNWLDHLIHSLVLFIAGIYYHYHYPNDTKLKLILAAGYFAVALLFSILFKLRKNSKNKNIQR